MNASRHLPRHRSRPHARVCLAVAVVALAIFTASALPQTISGFERAVFDAVNGLTGTLEGPLWVPMQLGAVWATPVVALLAVLVWRRVRPPLDLALAGSLAWVLAKGLKSLVGRGRPGAFLGEVNLRGAGEVGRTGLGFPSGHATVAFAMAVVVYPYVTPRWRAALLGLAAVVALARLYFGAHFPLDALGGATLGVAVGTSVHLLMDVLVSDPALAAPGPD